MLFHLFLFNILNFESSDIRNYQNRTFDLNLKYLLAFLVINFEKKVFLVIPDNFILTRM